MPGAAPLNPFAAAWSAALNGNTNATASSIDLRVPETASAGTRATKAIGSETTKANSDATLTVVHEDAPDRYRVEATVSTPPRARTVTLDAKTHHAILPFAEFGAVEENAQGGKPRPPMKPDSFGIVIVGRK